MNLKRRFFPLGVSAIVESFTASRAETLGGSSSLYVYETNKKYFEISTLYERVEQLSMIIG